MTDLSLNETGTASSTTFTSHPSKFVDEERDQMFYEKEKIGSHILLCILLLMGVYLLASLCFYEHKVYCKNQKKRKNLRQRDELVRDRTSDIMRWLCLVASLTILARCVIDMVEIWHGQTSIIVCDSMIKAKNIILMLAIVSIFTVLWLRQRSLYKAPALKQLSNKTIRFFSKSCIVLIIVASLLTCSLYIFTRSYMPSARGCIVVWSSIWIPLIHLLVYVLVTIFQFILLGLLIYPLYQHWRTTTNLNLINQKKTIALLQRVTIVTLFAAVIDVLAGLIVLVVIWDSFAVLIDVIIDMELLINIIAVICSFKDWRSRLCPYFAKKGKFQGTIKRRNVENNVTGITVISDKA